jgi:hypothetical protein
MISEELQEKQVGNLPRDCQIKVENTVRMTRIKLPSTPPAVKREDQIDATINLLQRDKRVVEEERERKLTEKTPDTSTIRIKLPSTPRAVKRDDQIDVVTALQQKENQMKAAISR